MATEYKRIESIGTGGFGEVWHVQRSTDNADLAMKVLNDTDEESVKRFQREVRIVERLSHPNIVSILGKRLTEPPYFYLMPLASHSLFDECSKIVGDHARIKVVFNAVLSAVQFAHTEGVIHRDLKPENVLIMADGTVVVADFGLGRQLTSQSTRITRTGDNMGTPFYCAPEQIADAKAATAQSDVFSLGQMLHDVYAGLSTVQDLDSVPYSIAAIIRRATKRDPQKRYKTVQAFADAFMLAIEALTGEADLASLDTLIEKLNSKLEAGDPFKQLLQGLANCADNGDAVHSAIMKIDPELFKAVAETDPPLARRVSIAYADFVTSQEWGFSYTDEIGAKAQALFNSVADIEIRIAFLRAALIVGTQHNRWDVMRMFARMLEAVSGNEEAAATADALMPLDGALGQVHSYVALGKLRPALRNLFKSDEQ